MPKISFLFLILLLLLPSCSLTSVERFDSEFVKLLQDPNVKDLNNSLSLRLDPYNVNSLKFGELIYLEAINKAERDIFIPPGSTVQIFRYDDHGKTWIQVKDTVNHYGEGITTSPEEKDSITSAPFVVNPIIETPKKEELVRIAVTGFFIESGERTSEPVSAYLDLIITAY